MLPPDWLREGCRDTTTESGEGYACRPPEVGLSPLFGCPRIARAIHNQKLGFLGTIGIGAVSPRTRRFFIVVGKRRIHDFALLYLGVHLFDNCDLEALADAAAERNRWDFLLTAAPLPIRGGTGSPANPIATF
jgi:hypothetical protein